MEVNNLPHEYLPPEEAILVEDGIDVENIDADEVVFVDDIGDMIVAESVYQQWHEDAVALEEISGDEQLGLQAYVNESEEAYGEQHYEYSQNETVPAEAAHLGAHTPLDDAVATRYDEIQYADDELVPGESAHIEYETDSDRVARGRRKPLTIIQCEVCGVVVKHPSKIEAHMRTHTGEKPFECEICGAKFTQRTPMLNHVRRHLGQTPYVCGYGCGKSFVNNAQKNAHELRHTGSKRSGPPRPYLKPPKRHVWNKAITKPESRSRQSDEERATMVDFAPPVGQIEPPISAAASKRLDEVIESVVTGIPIKKRKTRPVRASMLVQCQVCGLMLKHASKIKAHIRTHTGDKPFACVYCDAQFNTSSTLNMHIKRKHTAGERPFACTWDCGKRFVSLSTRNEHERVVHAGTKRYECTVPGCYRMFTRRCYLMLHRQKEHGLLFKPVFDPQEIEKAEKEADMELMTEKEDGTNEFGNDKILVDPTTNMLVHVSDDGMVLEPLAEQPVFIGEFVETSMEPVLEEDVEDEASEKSASYVPAEHSKDVHYVPSDIGLELGSSGVVGVPLLEEDVEESRHGVEDGDMPVLTEEQSLKSAKKVGRERFDQQTLPKERVVNILKRKLPVRLPRMQ